MHAKNVREDLLRTLNTSRYKVKLVRTPYLGLFMFLFIQIKANIVKRSRSRILTT